MIEQIVAISNVGTFFGFRPEQPVALRKLTLLYGPNATGKTTLCAILRSLARNDPDIMRGRKTLKSQGEARVELGLAGGGRCLWDGTAWSGPTPKIEIYDEQFVRENLFTDSVELDHQHHLLQVILGEQAVAIAREIRQKNDEGERTQREITALEKEIEKDKEIDNIKDGSIETQDFLKLPKDPEIDSKIEAQRKKLAAHENAERLQKEKGLAPLPFPALLEGLDVLFASSFDGLVTDAERLLRDHLERCGGKSGHRAWLERGLDYVEGERCPFCGQTLCGVALVHAYRTLFSERYRAHKAEIKAALGEVDKRFGGEALARFGEIMANNAERARFWQAYLPERGCLPSEFHGLNEAWIAYRDGAKAALEAKRRAPLEAVAGEEVRAAAERLQQAMNELRAHNDVIAAINTEIEDVKREASGEAIEKTRTELCRLELVKKRHEPDVASRCDRYKELLKKKQMIERDKDSLQHKLVKIEQDLLEKTNERVNQLLKEFAADFRLHELKKKQIRGKVAAGWSIVIRKTAIDVAKKPQPSEPNFRNTLSAGDRSALAFAFFLAQLEQKPDLGERIVVLDDPFTSQDAHRQEVTRKSIEDLRASVAQILVLSHQPMFLFNVWEGAKNKDPRTSLEIAQKAEEGSLLKKVDLEGLVTDRHSLYKAKMMAFFREQEGDPWEIAKGLRPYIEQELKSLFPEKVGPKDTLGNAIEKIRHLLADSDVRIEDLKCVCEYANRWHHATGTVADSEAPDRNELRGMIRRTLDVLGSIYKKVAG